MINIGIGLSWGTKKIFSKINNIIKTFVLRVSNDSGTYEAGNCLNNTLNSLNSIP